MSEIQVSLASDSKMAMPLAVAAYSVLSRSSEAEPVTLHVLDVGLTRRQKSRVLKLNSRFPYGRVVVQEDLVSRADRETGDAFMKLPSGLQPKFARVLLPSVLANEVRVIYLDCDVVVCSPLGPLWRTDLQNRMLAAVPDPGVDRVGDADGVGYVDDLPVREARYFNSGVMVLDLDRCRGDRLGARLADFGCKYARQLRLADQDAFNALCSHDYLSLDEEWNALVQVRGAWREWRPFDGSIGGNCNRVAKVMHFTGQQKPWCSGPRNPYGLFYARTLARSRWMRPYDWPLYLAKAFSPYSVRRRLPLVQAIQMAAALGEVSNSCG